MYTMELYHHGIKGQKWGVRRYQTKDGSLTDAGKKRYSRLDVVKSYGPRIVRGHAGPGIYPGSTKRRIEGYKKDLKLLDTGHHRSVGLTKKRQAALDARDRANVERRLTRLEGKQQFREARKEVSKSRSVGAKLATNILAGSFANRTYNSVIADGGSKLEAAGVTALAAVLGGGTPFGHIAVSALYTKAAGDRNLKQKNN